MHDFIRDECCTAYVITNTIFTYANVGTDPESTLRDAFIMFDTEGKGKLQEE